MKYRATSSVAKASARVCAAALYSDGLITRTVGAQRLVRGVLMEVADVLVEAVVGSSVLEVELVVDSMVMAALISSMLGSIFMLLDISLGYRARY